MASADALPHSPMSDHGGSTSLLTVTTAGDMKFHLQNLLDSKEKQLQQAGTLGQRVLAQQMELEERIRQLQESETDKSDDDEIDQEARDRYRELAESILAWDAENAQLSTAFGGSSKRFTNGKEPSPSLAFADLPREEPERTKAAGTTAAQSRRAKNAAHRADDVEFAFEIGSGLLTEVRRLQSLLGERDKAIQDMKEEKDDLEKSVEALRTALRQQEQSADKYKEENWNLEVTLQELRSQLGDYQASTQRLESEQKRLNKLLAASRDAGDQHKNETERLQNVIEDMKAKHETDVAQARKHAAGLARDKSDLQQTIDSLKAEVTRANRKFPRFGSPLTPGTGEVKDFITPAGTERDDAGDIFTTGGASTNRRKYDTSGLFPGDAFSNEYPDSPDASPLRRPFLAPNHPNNEIEALQQRLAHAQRQINTLKGSLNREKQLRKRLESTSQNGASEHEDEEEVEEEEVAPESQKGRHARRGGTPFKVGALRGSARRGRGRGGITLIQRLGLVAGDDDDDEHDSSHDSSGAPPVPPIPISFTQAEDEEEENFFNTSGVNITKDHIAPAHEDDELEATREDRSPSPTAPPSNRASIEGMDPAFANVLKRVPSNGSSYAGSPLRHSLLSRHGSRRGGRGTGSVGRRSRGGVPFKEARPPSLVNDRPEALAAELGLGTGSLEGSPLKTLNALNQMSGFDGSSSPTRTGFDNSIREEEDELAAWRKEVVGDEEEEIEEVEMKEFGCQTEPPEEMEVEKTMVMGEKTMLADTPPAPVQMVEFGVQAEPVEEKVMAEMQIQTEEETVKPMLVDSGVATEPEQEVLGSPYGRLRDGSRRTTITQSDMSFSSSGNNTITRSFLARAQALGDFDDLDDGEETETGADTEAGAETETDTDNYYDARQSIAMTTPSAQFSESREDFHSIMTVSDHEYPDSSDEEDVESVKASRISSAAASRTNVGIGAGMIIGGAPGGVHVDPNEGRRSTSPSVASYYTGHQAPTVTYATVGVSANLYKEPEPVVVIKEVPVEVRVEVPVEVPVRVEVPVEVPVRVEVPVEVKVPVEVPVEVKVPVEVPKPEVKEVEIQTDSEPKITVEAPKRELSSQSVQVTPASPTSGPVFIPPGVSASISAPAAATGGIPSSPGLYRVGPAGQPHQFQFVPPPPPSGPAPSVSAQSTSPISAVFRTESTGPLSRASRLSTSDRRQSIDGAVPTAVGDVARPTPSPGGLLLSAVDKSRPPMMVLPPPPKAPPPPNTMPPPSFIPDRRGPLGVPPYSGDGPPPRPSSPPPVDLIQRATTPTFGNVLSVPGATKGLFAGLRQHGSSMPPLSANLRQLPSTSSFRSAAHQAAVAGTTSNVFTDRRQFSTTSLVPSDRSVASPRSSISSSDHQQGGQGHSRAGTDMPTTPNKSADMTPRANGQATDPAIIHAITQTMIGEFLYKYTRKAIGKGYGEKRHRRFFWVHPYTKTLYWSSLDPGSSNVSESSAKSAYIEGVRSVLDPNPMPPGLYQYSVVISTPQREMKFTAPTKDRHDIWLNALKYLLSRPSPNMTTGANGTLLAQSPLDFADDDREHRRPRLLSSPQSFRSSKNGTPGETWNTTPRGKRSQSQLSVKGSVGKRTGTPALEYLRWNTPESPYSPTKSFVDVPGQGQDEDDLDFELHDESLSDGGFEGLENVRACCDGRHTVGHSGRHHHHHHHHHQHNTLASHPIHQLQQQAHAHTAPIGRPSVDNQHLDPNPMELGRPVSPAWSLRSRPGSAQSHEGGGGLFSWGRGEGSKLRFGSKRSTKTSTAAPTD